MKRIMILAFLAVFILSACGGGSEEVVPEFTSGTENSTDFEGREFVILQEAYDDPEVIFRYEPDSLYYDMLMTHIKNIEDNNNLILTYRKNMGNEGSFSGTVFSSYIAGIHLSDYVIMRGSNNNMSTAQAGAFYPLNYFPDVIDLKNSDKYGPINILECCMAKGNVYGVIPNYWPLRSNDGNMGLLVTINENHITRYSLDDPRDMYEQNEWKLSRLEEIMPVFHIIDGSNDIKALGMNTRYLARGFMGSYRIGNVYEQNGEYVSSDNNPDFLSALEWGYNFIHNYDDDYLILPGWDFSENLANGECVMAFSESSYLLNLANLLDNFGLVPFPTADKYDCKDINMSFSTYPTFSMFAGAEDPDACAKVIDILFEPIEGTSKEGMVEMLFRQMFFDERDAVLYTELYNHAVYDYMALGGNLMQKIETVYDTKSPQEVVSSVSGTLDKMFETYILPNYLTMQEYK